MDEALGAESRPQGVSNTSDLLGLSRQLAIRCIWQFPKPDPQRWDMYSMFMVAEYNGYYRRISQHDKCT